MYRSKRQEKRAISLRTLHCDYTVPQFHPKQRSCDHAHRVFASHKHIPRPPRPCHSSNVSAWKLAPASAAAAAQAHFNGSGPQVNTSVRLASHPSTKPASAARTSGRPFVKAKPPSSAESAALPRPADVRKSVYAKRPSNELASMARNVSPKSCGILASRRLHSSSTRRGCWDRVPILAALTADRYQCRSSEWHGVTPIPPQTSSSLSYSSMRGGSP
mmetsp:Transcript_57116/g.127499  ORF Transcript_57116/g.127499 Transcript_57116/m.127499 type:complete len:217 (+) Transcript_57116:228-878(+)